MMDTIAQLLAKEELFFGKVKNNLNIRSTEFPISFHNQCLDELKRNSQAKIQKYGLNDSELLSLLLLMGNAYSLIQECLYTGNCNELAQSLHECLDSALLKLPKCDAEKLYRREDDFRRKIDDIKTGGTITIPAYFTTSLDDFEDAQNIVWIITPLKKELTKARNLFEIYNPADEYQVNFERNTSFIVKDVVKQENDSLPHIVYISEVFSI